MSVFSVNKNPSKKDLHAFGKAMLLGFGILGALVWTVHYFRTEPESLFAWTGSGAQLSAEIGQPRLCVARLWFYQV